MTPLIAPTFLLLAYAFLFWVRGGPRGGVIGQRIRNSDHWAWRMAVEETEQRMRELRALRWTHYRRDQFSWQMEMDIAEGRLLALHRCEPRLHGEP